MGEWTKDEGKAQTRDCSVGDPSEGTGNGVSKSSNGDNRKT